MKPFTQEQRDLVERIGVLYDQSGMRPAAGRIEGLLIVAGEGELTFDEIRETLGLSKSAISTSLQMLQDIGTVTYRTRPGDRKRYFRKKVDDWEARFVERGMRFLEIRYLFAEALASRASIDPDSDAAVERMVGFLDLVSDSVRRAHEEWESRSAIEIEDLAGTS